jgi:hypothetical protein
VVELVVLIPAVVTPLPWDGVVKLPGGVMPLPWVLAVGVFQPWTVCPDAVAVVGLLALAMGVRCGEF